MKNTIEVSPPNSLILIMDQSIGEIPESMNGKLVACTDSCIAVGTRSEIDGNTEIFLGFKPNSDIKLDLAFKGEIRTPNRKIHICNVYDEKLLETTVSSERSSIEVWVNDKSEPSLISVLVM